jgi:2-desacetyl-2-hydroxyethyl bacteriochlorophyllide A dehydrogenase
MKAAVFHGERDIRVEDVPDPMIKPDGIIVKVKASGICGSDLLPYRQGVPGGLIFGHECSGDVVEVGGNVTSVKEGDRVVGLPLDVCWQCSQCEQQQFLHCSDVKMVGWHIPGAFAEFVSIPFFIENYTVTRIPENLSYEEGTTVEPLSIAVYSVTKAQVQPGDKVVVIGAGMIGLCVIQVLKTIGVSQITISERRSRRLELAGQLGANMVIDATTDDIVSMIKDSGPEREADVVFECVGLPSTFQQSIDIVRPGGKVALIGVFEQTVNWSPNAAVLKDVTLIGCLGEDFSGAVDLLRSEKVDTKSLISHEFPLDRAKEAFDTSLEADNAIKVILKP